MEQEGRQHLLIIRVRHDAPVIDTELPTAELEPFKVAVQLLAVAGLYDRGIRNHVERPFDIHEADRPVKIEIQFFLLRYGEQRLCLRFLEKEPVRAFMDNGRAVSDYQQDYVMAIFDAFNDKINHGLQLEKMVSLGNVRTK